MRAFEAVTGKKLTVRHEKGRGIVRVPKFSILACEVVEPKGIGGRGLNTGTADAPVGSMPETLDSFTRITTRTS